MDQLSAALDERFWRQGMLTASIASQSTKSLETSYHNNSAGSQLGLVRDFREILRDKYGMTHRYWGNLLHDNKFWNVK